MNRSLFLSLSLDLSLDLSLSFVPDTRNAASKLIDAECMGRWLMILKEGTITGIVKVWGFVDTHNGAITFTINNRYKALFKVRPLDLFVSISLS